MYNSPLSTSFHFKMLFSIVYMFWSRFLFSHCFLSCLLCGSLSCNLASLLSFRGRWISVFISIGSVCWMFILPISHSITSSTWMVPKYRSNSVYTSIYKRHRTVQYEGSSRAVSSIGAAAQLGTRHSQEHTLSAVGPDVPVESHIDW